MGGGFFPDDLPSIDWRDTLPDRAFFIASLVIAVILIVKEYAELVMEAIGQIPKSICFLYLVGAYTFVYVCFAIAVELEDTARVDAVVQMVRSSLIVGGMFMLIGPLLILSPIRKITVTSRIGRAIVGTAHRKESRYTALVFFLLLVVAQLVVVYSMALVLRSVFNLELVDVIGLCICYFLLSLFYLVVFYGSMTRSPVKFRGNDPVAAIRANLPWLEDKWYLYAYVCVYAMKMLGILIGTSILFDQDRRNHNSMKGSDDAAYAVSCTFFVLTLLALIAFAVFLLVEAFRVKKKVVQPAVEVEVEADDDDDERAPVAKKRRARKIVQGGGGGVSRFSTSSRSSASSSSSSSSSSSASPGYEDEESDYNTTCDKDLDDVARRVADIGAMGEAMKAELNEQTNTIDALEPAKTKNAKPKARKHKKAKSKEELKPKKRGLGMWKASKAAPKASKRANAREAVAVRAKQSVSDSESEEDRIPGPARGLQRLASTTAPPTGAPGALEELAAQISSSIPAAPAPSSSQPPPPPPAMASPPAAATTVRNPTFNMSGGGRRDVSDDDGEDNLFDQFRPRAASTTAAPAGAPGAMDSDSCEDLDASADEGASSAYSAGPGDVWDERRSTAGSTARNRRKKKAKHKYEARASAKAAEGVLARRAMLGSDYSDEDEERLGMFDADVCDSASDGGDDAAETAHPGGLSDDNCDDSTHLVQFSFEVRSDDALTKTNLHSHLNTLVTTKGWHPKRGTPRIVQTSDGVWRVEVAVYVPTAMSRDTVVRDVKSALSTQMPQAKFTWD